jgi:Domain of unknown function (DUF222)/HNH endonuclease
MAPTTAFRLNHTHPDVDPSEIPASLLPDARPVDILGEKIAVLAAQIDAATWHLLKMIAAFDRGNGWGNGFASCAHWLNWRTGLDLGAAREKVRVARAIESLPAISQAMRKGELSYSKVRALTRVATPENEEELLGFARAGTAAHVERLVRHMRRIDRQVAAERERLQHESRFLELRTDEDGMVRVRGRLTPEAGTALRKALEAGADKLYEETPPDETEEYSATQRRADAIGVVAEAALAGGSESGLDAGTRGDRYQVVVHVDGESSWIEGTGDVSAETSERLACDASQVMMLHGPGGQILDVGRKRRTIPPAIRRALDTRDRRRTGGCRFPGCAVTFCDAHHVEPWSAGGETKLDNLILLCRRHHRLVHEEGWRVELLPSGEARFYDSFGRFVPDAPGVKLPWLPPRRAIRARLAADGVEIRPENVPVWDGTRVNWIYAVSDLWAIGREDVSAETSEVNRAIQAPETAPSTRTREQEHLPQW